MPKGELFIRFSDKQAWQDAYTKYGISFDQTSLSALMTPVPNKPFIENKSRLEHGKRVINNNPKKDERNLTLSFNLTASDETQFMQRYVTLCKMLELGYVELKTKYQEDVVYKMSYEGCTQFSQFRRSIGKFSLKLNEPNPDDRG